MPEWDRVILHADMNAFYASVEVLDDPSLAGQPVLVGGTGGRGVVASASYEARAAGVFSAMPMARALRLCPAAVVLPGRFERYREVSEQVFGVFGEFTPLVEGLSTDEAFLDLSGARRHHATPADAAAAVRGRVRDVTGLWCSVGAATTKLMAKLGSEAAKPAPGQDPASTEGVRVVEPGTELAFLHPLPVRRLWGVGPATAARLARLGIATIGDLADANVDALVRVLGQQGRHLHELAWAHDERPVLADHETKSISQATTFPVDLRARADLHRRIVALADGVAGRLRGAGLAARTVTLQVRFASFRTVSRSVTFEAPVTAGPVIVAAATGLLDRVDPDEVATGVRLLGVAVSNLVAPPAEQMTLDDPSLGDRDGRDWTALTQAVDGIRARFGSRAITPAGGLPTGDDST